MRVALSALALSALVLAAAPAQAEVIEIAPNGPWSVDFGETRCRLARFFGEGENRHLLFFEQYAPSAGFGMTAAGPAFRSFGDRMRTELRFNDKQTPRKTEPYAGKVAGYGDAVIYSSLSIAGEVEGDEAANEVNAAGIPALDKTSARAVQFVSLRQRGDEVRLMTGPLDGAFAVLDSCALDLVGTWGLDVAAHRTATSLPRFLNREAVVRRIVAEYPRNAAAFGEQGIMRMRVTISAEGKVEDCAIIKATQADRLESPACRAMVLARFEPARDVAGQPMRSYFTESIIYQMGR